MCLYKAWWLGLHRQLCNHTDNDFQIPSVGLCLYIRTKSRLTALWRICHRPDNIFMRWIKYWISRKRLTGGEPSHFSYLSFGFKPSKYGNYVRTIAYQPFPKKIGTSLEKRCTVGSLILYPSTPPWIRFESLNQRSTSMNFWQALLRELPEIYRYRFGTRVL